MNGTRNGSSNKPHTPTGWLAGTTPVGDLFDLILYEQMSLSDLESDAVCALVLVGWYVLRLKPIAAGKWPVGLYSLVPSRRVARQLRAVGKALGGGDGRVAPDLAPHLPANPGKLAQLARLNAGQLREIVMDLDCRKATLKAITAAVDASLGVARHSAAADVVIDETRPATVKNGTAPPARENPEVRSPSEMLRERIAALRASREAAEAAHGRNCH